MSKVINFISDPKFRLWMYGVALAVLPLLTFISAEDRGTWANVIMMVLAIGAPGTALKNYTGKTETAIKQYVEAATHGEEG